MSDMPAPPPTRYVREDGGRVRPDDVPSWRNCFADGLRWTGWMLPAFMAMFSLLAWSLINVPADPSHPIVRTTFLYLTFNGVALFMWLLVFYGWVSQARRAETPKEIEARERALLAKLQAKYKD